eukprot:9098542-Lingulodinium_polyedra.AAC.1
MQAEQSLGDEALEPSEGGHACSSYLSTGCSFLRFADFLSLQQVSMKRMCICAYLLDELF